MTNFVSLSFLYLVHGSVLILLPLKMVTGGETRVSLGYATKYWTLAQACSTDTDQKFRDLESKYGGKVPLLKSYVVDSTQFREMETEGQIHVLERVDVMHDRYLKDVASNIPKTERKPCTGQGILHVPNCAFFFVL